MDAHPIRQGRAQRRIQRADRRMARDAGWRRTGARAWRKDTLRRWPSSSDARSAEGRITGPRPSCARMLATACSNRVRRRSASG